MRETVASNPHKVWGTSVAVTASGTIIVGGRLQGTVAFDPTDLGDPDVASSVAGSVDSLGRLTVTGVAAGDVDFGGGVESAQGWEDVFVAGFRSADGGYRWARMFGNANASALFGAISEGGYGLAAGENGQLLASGTLYMSGDPGGGTLSGPYNIAFATLYGP